VGSRAPQKMEIEFLFLMYRMSFPTIAHHNRVRPFAGWENLNAEKSAFRKNGKRAPGMGSGVVADKKKNGGPRGEDGERGGEDGKAEADEEYDELDIVPMKTVKSKIRQNRLMKNDVIPRHPSSVIFNGSSGSGKSTLLTNLLTKPQFYGKYFKRKDIYLISPTGASDDMFEHLNLPEENISTDLRNTNFLEEILEKQKRDIEDKGTDKARRVLIIFEDIQSNARYMNKPAFKKCFLMNRHYGCSVWLCGQSFKLTPRACRLQANNLFVFQPSNSERQIILEEFAPPGMTRRQFEKLFDHCVSERFSFMHINRRAPFEERYRKNLKHIVSF